MAATIDAGRRALLRGRLSPPPPAVRPPWAMAEQDFLDACTRCGGCVDACPERIVKAGASGYPRIDFHAGGCTFCAACADACPDGAFANRDAAAPWHHAAAIGEACLAGRGVFCMSCRDACDAGAITFARQAASVPAPTLDTARCTGCGACIATCPAEAIDIVPGQHHGTGA